MNTTRLVLLLIGSLALNEAAARDSMVIKPPVDKCAESPDADGCSPAVTKPPVDKCIAAPDAEGCTPAVTRRHVDRCTLSADRSCKAGYVWRLAGPDDLLCVHPDWASRAQLDNEDAEDNVDPSGSEGPDTCKPGLVWREAFPGDVVCVTQEVRLMTRDQNRNPDSYRACD